MIFDVYMHIIIVILNVYWSIANEESQSPKMSKITT